MKGLDTGKDKIQKICDALKKETLDPAKQEAREIIENAHLQAKQIVQEATREKEALLKQAEEEMKEQRKRFDSSLQLASRQGIAMLKQRIEEELFNKGLKDLILQEMQKPEVIASLIGSLVSAMEKRGVTEDFVAKIPKEISPKEINLLLGEAILQRLSHKSVQVGDFLGGVEISLKDKEITIDISEKALYDLVSQFIRRDFREMLYHL